MANPRCAVIACNEIVAAEDPRFCSYLCHCYFFYQAAHTPGEESYYHKLWDEEHFQKFKNCRTYTPHVHPKEQSSYVMEEDDPLVQKQINSR